MNIHLIDTRNSALTHALKCFSGAITYLKSTATDRLLVAVFSLKRLKDRYAFPLKNASYKQLALS